MLGDVLAATAVAAALYFVLVNAFQTVLMASAAWSLRQERLRSWGESHQRLLSSPAAPRISILAPAYNEAVTIRQTVQALLTLHYPNLEVVIVNDGSTDATLRVLTDAYSLGPIHPSVRRQIATQPVLALYRSATHPRLVVADKVNGGKADALNAALNLASGELVCAMDADTLIEPEALLRIVRPFLSDERVVAAGGTIRVANGSTVRAGRVVQARAPRGWLAGVQTVEYLRAFLFGRLGWNGLGGNLIISGAFGLFRREAVIAAGGYVHETVGEDMELVANIRRRGIERGRPHRVAFVADPVAWTEVPDRLRLLGRQRDRWHRGLADVLWRHRRVIGRPAYGTLGLVAGPYFLAAELLAPVVELVGWLAVGGAVGLGTLDPTFALLFALIAYGWGILLSVVALVLEDYGPTRYPQPRDKALLTLWALCEHLGYRQFTIVWRLRGLVSYLRRRTDWGAMPRRGFEPERTTKSS
jgi:cellulose synthase/poly-beta-1,6-N-acetylglucosamine synthase-like glycosyltransferase